MTLLSDAPTPLRHGGIAHCLVPLVEKSSGFRVTVGWMCKRPLCGVSWDELPPISERLTGCPGD
jgi:hypothetical protein